MVQAHRGRLRSLVGGADAWMLATARTLVVPVFAIVVIVLTLKAVARPAASG